MRKQTLVPLFVPIVLFSIGLFFINGFVIWLFAPEVFMLKTAGFSQITKDNIDLFYRLNISVIAGFNLGFMFMYVAVKDRFFSLLALGLLSCSYLLSTASFYQLSEQDFWLKLVATGQHREVIVLFISLTAFVFGALITLSNWFKEKVV